MPTVVDERGRTPLMDALVHGNDNAVKEQVELGAHVNAFDNEVGRLYCNKRPVSLSHRHILTAYVTCCGR